MSMCVGPRIGDMTLCRECGKAIQLQRSTNPDTRVDHDFWVHFASIAINGPIETHKAVPKRSLWDYEMTRFGPFPWDRLPLTRGAWFTNEDGLTMSGAAVCATCDGGGCRDCIG